MAKISDLPSGVLSSGDLIPIVQGGVTKQVPSPFDTEANGSVGTGGGLSAWGSGFVVMEINNIETTFHDVATFNAGVAHNCYNNGTSWLRTSAGGTACRLTYSVAGGQKFELYAAAGAADSVITWTTHQILGTDGTLEQTAGIYLGGTATANLLDDYEEGTWTMVLTFGGASVGITYASQTGGYTKVGDSVRVSGFMVLTNKGTSTGNVLLEGLPFTVTDSSAAYAPSALRLNTVSFADYPQAYGGIGTNIVIFEEVTDAGAKTALTDVNFTNSSAIMLSMVYPTDL